MGKIREGRWDCPTCDTRAIRGGERICPRCGSPRPADVRFYLPADAPVVTDENKLIEARAGADWYCEHCGAGNSNLRDTCQQCGASKGSSPHHRITDYSLGSIPRSSDEGNDPQEDYRSSVVSPTDRSLSEMKPGQRFVRGDQSLFSLKRLSPSFWLPILIGALVLLFGLTTFLLFRPHEIPVTVQGFNWERQIVVEVYQPVIEQGWSLPPGAKYLSERETIHHYESVFDHYETKYRQVCETVQDGYDTEYDQDCRSVQTGTETYVCGSRDLGNGYFEDIECSEPVYETRCEQTSRQVPRYIEECQDEAYQDPVYRPEPRYATEYTYEIKKWVHSRSPKTSGNNHEPYWLELELLSNEREMKRLESYTVIFANEEKERTYTYETDLEQWSSFDQGQELEIKANSLGLVTEIIKD